MATKQEERSEVLTRALMSRGQLHLKQAAELLNVSEMTVRRDVSALPRQFLYLGGYIVLAPAIRSYQLSSEGDEVTAMKVAASRHALELIRPDTTIFIDSGTTLLHLAALIPAGLELTVVTGSLNVAARLGERSNIRLVLLGGIYHPASDCFTNDDPTNMLNMLGINQAFLSAGGLDFERGASCYQFHEALLKKQVMARAERSYLIVDSSKLGRVHPAFFASATAFDGIITEAGVVS